MLAPIASPVQRLLFTTNKQTVAHVHQPDYFYYLDSSAASTSVKPKLVLTDPPVHCDLLNKVAVKTPQKWKEIGLQLQVSHADIEAISMGNQTPILCFSKVFKKWRTKGVPSLHVGYHY